MDLIEEKVCIVRIWEYKVKGNKMVSAVGPYLNRIGNTIIAGFPLIQAAEQRWISNDLDYTGDKETIKGQFGS